MAISFVGSKVTGNNPATVSLTDLTGGIASAPAAGDLVVIYYGGNETGSGFGVTGYTELFETSYNNSSPEDVCLGVYWKLMGETPDTDVTFSGITGPNTELAAILVFRGVDPTTPMDVTRTFTSGQFATVNPPAITPITPGAWIIAGGAAVYDGIPVQTLSSSELSGFTQVSHDPVGDTVLNVAAGYYTGWTSGAFDPAQFTFSTITNSDHSQIAATLALRPKIVPRSQAIIIH
jgi:hypothetical protein